ncbi:hypothetical protein BGZ96_003332 [Linnemannia gamsii]|uniref:Uncharacterized protein n=1 Tax=Linnemannia gamsii TaxID=64522 RepID=A0ABQ7JJL5_9FUNG|nr:hypothetical protein BGZ96_003332 [Linnemannia gamsii]
MSTVQESAGGTLYSTTEKSISRFVKSEMSLVRLLLVVATALAVLGYMTFSALPFAVSKDNVMMSKFKVHPPSLHLTLLTGAIVGLVSILVALFVPSAFAYVRVHVTGARTADKKKRKESNPASAPVSDGRVSWSTTEPFEAYRKQAGKAGTSGSGRHPRHGSNATLGAVKETLAASKKHSDKEN